MRFGAWDVDSPVRQVTGRVIVSGVERPAAELSVESHMLDGHPAAVDTSPETTGSVTWDQAATVTTHAPDPWTDVEWVPGGGKPINIYVTRRLSDPIGSLYSYRIARGWVHEVQGQITDTSSGCDLIDHTSDLNVRIQRPAITPVMYPHAEGGGAWRRVGLCATWLQDWCMREAGYYCTAPHTGDAQLVVPMQGSMWPHSNIGSCVTASRLGDPAAQPSWTRTDWGLAASEAQAVYALDTPARDVVVTLSLGGHYSGESQAYVDLLDTDTATNVGFWIGWDATTDEIMCGLVGSGRTTNRFPRNGADRIAAHFAPNGGSGVLTLCINDGREITRTLSHADLTGGWRCRKVKVAAGAAIGGLLVETNKRNDSTGDFRFLPFIAPRTARIQVGDVLWWSACPDLITMTAREILESQAQAEMGCLWMEDDAILRYAGRGVLEGQTPVATYTTSLQVDDVQWTDSARSLAQSVWLRGSEPSVSYMSEPRNTVWVGSSQELAAGETVTEDIEAPSGEDWIGVDLSSTMLTQGNTRAAIIKNSVCAGTDVWESPNGDGGTLEAWSWHLWCMMSRLGARRYRIQLGATTDLPSGWKVATRTPTGTEATNMPPYWRGKEMPRMRAHIVTQWSDWEISGSGGTEGPRRLEHDVGFWVQNSAQRDVLKAALQDVAKSRVPNITSVTLDLDPRVQIGDSVWIEDPHRTGLRIRLLVTGIRYEVTDGYVGSMSLSGRVVSAARVWDVPDGEHRTWLTRNDDWLTPAA